MTNNDAKVLELQLKTTGEKTLVLFEQLVKSLTGIENVLTNIYLQMGHIEKGSKNIVKDVKDIGTATEETTKKVTNLGSALKGAFTFASVKRLGMKILDFLGESTDRAEELNLFNVIFKNVEKNGEKTFSDLGKSAMKFQNRLNEAFGTNMTETLRFQGLFQAMATNAGIAEKEASIMSENMTKLTYDLASLYNQEDESVVAEALRAGVYAGQTKPLRKYGIDVTQTSFKPLMAELGITKSVNELSQGEKQILRYISALRQASSSMADFADTIESPANQLKIFKNQIVETKTAIGNLFMGMYADILPYANAILMVIKHIAKAIAGVFGIETHDYNTGLASTEDLYNGIADGASSATKATKELKRQILGFDQINNITSPSKSGSSSGSGGVNGGIDKRLLNAIKGYDNLMEKVEMKANRIRDAIMKWLGFTKEEGDELDEVKFKFDHITYGTILTALGVGGSIYLGIKKIFEFIKGITGLKAAGGGILGLLGKMLGSKSGGKSKGVASEFGLPSIKTVLTGVAELAIVVGGVTAVILAIGALNSIPGVEDIATRGVDLLKQVFSGLGSIALPLAGISALTAILGTIGVATISKGFADLAIILGGVTVLLTAIGAFISIPNFETFLTVGIDSVKRAILGLSEVGTQLALFSAGIIVLGIASPATILSGLAGFASIIGGLELILVALGALAQIPGFTWIVGEGGKLLLHLGETLGGFAGSIVSGFLNVSTAGLEKVGTNLSKFMVSAKPFFEGVSIVDESTTRSVDNLASAILKLTASNILDGLTSWFTGGNSLTKFGKDLVAFAPNFRKYSEEMAGVKADVVEKTSKAALTIAEFAKKIPNEGGLISLFVGDNTLKQFASYLPDFGTKLKQYSSNISGIKLDVVEKTSQAVETIMEFAGKTPNEGGLISWVVGDNKLDKFASYLPNFGKYLKQYSDNIKGIDAGVVQNTSSAVNSIMEFVNKVPNEGGIKAWFTGSYNIADFGYDLKFFGQWFKEYYTSVSSIGVDKINSVTNALAELVKNFITIKNNGIEKTVESFGKELKNSASNYKSFFETNLSYNNGSSIGSNFGNGIANGIKNKLKNFTFPSIKLTDASGNSVASYKIKAVAMGGVFNGKEWKNIPQYANGGVPTHGTLFQAGENGAEIVGNINRRTEVLNRSQIASAIYSAVSEAMNNATIGGGEVHLYAHTDEGVIIDRINRKTKQTGVCPINIPA